MLVFGERGNPEYPGKNLSWQSREPTNSTHIWRPIQESNLGHIGGRPVLSPLCQHCSLILCSVLIFCINVVSLCLQTKITCNNKYQKHLSSYKSGPVEPHKIKGCTCKNSKKSSRSDHEPWSKSWTIDTAVSTSTVLWSWFCWRKNSYQINLVLFYLLLFNVHYEQRDIKWIHKVSQCTCPIFQLLHVHALLQNNKNVANKKVLTAKYCNVILLWAKKHLRSFNTENWHALIFNWCHS